MRISTWFEALIMHNIRSQWLLNIESIFFAGSLLVVMFSLTSFNASSRSEKSLSLEFSIFKHSDPKKPIGKSSELIFETRHILTTPSSMFRYFEFLVSSRSENVISKLCPLLRQCNGRMSIFRLLYLRFSERSPSYESSGCIKWLYSCMRSWATAMNVGCLSFSLIYA